MYGHINRMSRLSNREKILTQGLRVVHERGFANASVRDIVQAAGVPQGSFTNHFPSKEAFGLEILDLYLANTRALRTETLCDASLSPLQRLGAYIDANMNSLSRHGMRNGCLFGNFTAEASDHSELIRRRLVEIFAETTQAIADCLRAAVAAGELPADFECDEAAGFVLSSLQGASLVAKAERSAAPLECFRRMLFSKVLR